MSPQINDLSPHMPYCYACSIYPKKFGTGERCLPRCRTGCSPVPNIKSDAGEEIPSEKVVLSRARFHTRTFGTSFELSAFYIYYIGSGLRYMYLSFSIQCNTCLLISGYITQFAYDHCLHLLVVLKNPNVVCLEIPSKLLATSW